MAQPDWFPEPIESQVLSAKWPLAPKYLGSCPQSPKGDMLYSIPFIFNKLLLSKSCVPRIDDILCNTRRDQLPFRKA